MIDAVSSSDAVEASSPAREALHMFMRNRAAILGVVLLLFVLLLTVVGRLIYPVDPFDIAGAPFTPPWTDRTVPLGTDHLGRNILAGLISGGLATLTVGGAAALLTLMIGLLVGALAGYYGGWVDEVLMRLTEFFQVLPSLILAMVLVSLFSPTLTTVTIAIGLVSWPTTARLTRAEFLKLKQLEYVKSARAIACSDAYIITRSHPAERPAAIGDFCDTRDRCSDPVRSRSFVPRSRRPQHHELGAHDRDGTAIRTRCLVGDCTAGLCHFLGRAGRQLDWRWPERRLQSEAA